jgi:uncharacterized membrane protein YraQ (UPF0718 family)
MSDNGANGAKEDSGKRTIDVRALMRRTFDKPFFAFVALAVAGGIATFHLKGAEAFDRALLESWHFILLIVPRMTAALLIAAFLQVLVPRELISKLIGARAGIGGMVIATLAGMATPGGPLTAFPIVVALYATGANKGALVAYLSAWAMFGFQRILVWEYPLMGGDFTLLRVCASAVLPVFAGMIALRLPWEIRAPAVPNPLQRK